MDGLVKRVLGDIYGSVEPLEVVTELCDEYEARWPGSGMDLEGCEYMAEKMRGHGLQDVHLEKFSIPGWIRGSSSLAMTEPKDKEIECIALPMSSEGTVEGELIYLEAGPVHIYDELEDAIEGKIVMVNSGNPRGMKRYLHRSEKYQRSVIAGATGWIFMNHYPAYGPPTGGISPVIPGVGVSYEDGMYLARMLERKGRVLAKERENLRHNIRFICFGAEEIGLFGSRAYCDDHPDFLKNVRFMMNFDGAGRAGRQGFCLHRWPGLEPLFKEVIKEIGTDLPLWQAVSPYSDHWPFVLKGIPTARMGDPDEAAKRAGRGFGHTKFDTVDKVDLRAMRECAGNAAVLALRLANMDEWPVERRTPDEIGELVTAQGLEETVRLGNRLKSCLEERRDSLRPETLAYIGRISGSWDEVL